MNQVEVTGTVVKPLIEKHKDGEFIRFQLKNPDSKGEFWCKCEDREYFRLKQYSLVLVIGMLKPVGKTLFIDVRTIIHLEKSKNLPYLGSVK